MSQPKRYGHKATAIGSVIRQRDNGEYVLYSDYAALAAEVERLNYKLGRLLMAEKEWELVEPGEYARIKNENERLRSASFVTAIPSEHYERVIKAGDEMMEVLESEIPFTAMNAVNGWLAAKEGGAS